jgi:hypothetical protein
LLSGENGTGKTSLAEALEWALFGTIVRKEQSKTRGVYPGVSWIRSVHASEDVETYAEVTLAEGGRRHVVRRALVGNGTELTVDGKSASDVRVLGLRTEEAFRPFLGRCEIQALIDSEQHSRWEQLSAILWLRGVRPTARAPTIATVASVGDRSDIGQEFGTDRSVGVGGDDAVDHVAGGRLLLGGHRVDDGVKEASGGLGRGVGQDDESGVQLDASDEGHVEHGGIFLSQTAAVAEAGGVVPALGEVDGKAW